MIAPVPTEDRLYVDALLQRATGFLHRSCPAMAEAYAREAVRAAPALPGGHTALGVLGERFGQWEAAWSHFETALATGEPAPVAARRLTRLAARFGDRAGALAALHARREANRTAGRVLVAKAWGYGFWADMVHLLGAFLLAEMSGRIPVVAWGTESNYWFPGAGNIFDRFFAPVSTLSVQDVAASARTVFPRKWRPETLGDEPVNLWRGPGSRLYGMTLLPRTDDVVVCDFVMPAQSFCRWLPSDHPLHGRDVRTVFRNLIRRHLLPRPEIADGVAAFRRAHLNRGPVLAVHQRNLNKAHDEPNLAAINQAITDTADRQMAAMDARTLLLITDSDAAVAHYRARFGDRMVTTDVLRPADETKPIFLSRDTGHKERAVRDILFDSYLAASCDAFVGNGSSAVSAAVGLLKDWPEDRLHLFGDDIAYNDYFTLYEPAAADRHGHTVA